MSQRIEGFAPIVFEDSEVLLLGTLPGAVSLERNYYYADDGNYFWQFFSEYTECEKPRNWEDVRNVLQKAKVALWDIYESAVRVDEQNNATSKDSDITDVCWNDIETFLGENPQIKRVGILGKKAYKEFVKKYPAFAKKCVYLPSTSGSNAAQWGGKPINRSRNGWKSFVSFIENT